MNISTPDNKSVPEHFVCPITGEVMEEPVATKQGHSFERLALLRHLANNDQKCPITGEKLFLSEITENGVLSREIANWMSEQQGPPLAYICPLTKELINEPVTTKYGNFEKQALLRYLATHNGKCPFSGKKMFLSEIIDNGRLALEIEMWRANELENDQPEDSANNQMPEPEDEQVPSQDEDIVESELATAPEKLGFEKLDIHQKTTLALGMMRQFASSDDDESWFGLEEEGKADVAEILDEVDDALQQYVY